MVNILLTLLFDKKNNDKIPKRHYNVNRVRDRGGILLLALFSGQVKDIAESPAPNCQLCGVMVSGNWGNAQI
jgi:hypothetical protein